MHDFIRPPDLLFIFQLAPSPSYVDTVFLDEFERNYVHRFLSEMLLKLIVMSFAFEMPSVSLGKHQPLVFTNIGKANVTKQKKVAQNYLPNYLQRLCTRYRLVLISYATEHCYLHSQKQHVSAHFYFQILSHWDFKVNPGGKLWVFLIYHAVTFNYFLALSDVLS